MSGWRWTTPRGYGSCSAARLDRRVKLADYRARGDSVIWLIHPRRRTLTAWEVQTDGSYSARRHTGGMVNIPTLPGVTTNVDELFAPA